MTRDKFVTIFISGLRTSLKNLLVAIEVTLVVAVGFLSKHFGGGGDLEMILCHSMNADSMVGIPCGGRDTQTLPCAKEFV